MSYPPPPGGPPPGNPGPPQGYSGPYGPPPQQPPWQQQWPPGPPPKKRGNVWKWLLGGVALLVVIGVTVAVTVSVTSDSGDGDDPAPSGETFGLASADDKGPANIITEDPSCAAWGPIQATLANSQGEWGNRDPSIPATAWTPKERAYYKAAGDAYREAAERTVALVKVTPSRVMRELYEQFIAYSRAYSDAIPTYSASDNFLAAVAISSSGALGFICGAITHSSAQGRAPFVPSPPAPEQVAPLRDPSTPERFLMTPDPTCREWDELLHKFSADTKEWQALDARVPATDWTPEQRATVDAVIPVMRAYADRIETLGSASSNPILQDFATLSSQYRRAYADALPTYTSADSYLVRAANRTTSTIFEACRAAGQ